MDTGVHVNENGHQHLKTGNVNFAVAKTRILLVGDNSMILILVYDQGKL